jgi:hypothetical protein
MARSPLMMELFCEDEDAALAGAIEDLRTVLFWAGGLLESGYFICSVTIIGLDFGINVMRKYELVSKTWTVP